MFQTYTAYGPRFLASIRVLPVGGTDPNTSVMGYVLDDQYASPMKNGGEFKAIWEQWARDTIREIQERGEYPDHPIIAIPQEGYGAYTVHTSVLHDEYVREISALGTACAVTLVAHAATDREMVQEYGQIIKGVAGAISGVYGHQIEMVKAAGEVIPG